MRTVNETLETDMLKGQTGRTIESQRTESWDEKRNIETRERGDKCKTDQTQSIRYEKRGDEINKRQSGYKKNETRQIWLDGMEREDIAGQRMKS